MKKALQTLIESKGFRLYGNLVMVGDELYPLPLVQGNEKLGKDVWHSSTLPTNASYTIETADGRQITESGTCPMACDGCYATKGNYRFSNVQFHLAMRTRLLREHMQAYFELVDAQITAEGIKRLRIHASGDFIDGEADGFRRVLSDHPDTLAWTYTKRAVSGDIARLDSLPNCNVVKSIIAGIGLNFGHVAYIANAFYILLRRGKKVHICRCGIDKNQHCSDCNGCATHEYVLFVEHSTGYNAEADYGYDRLVALIESQAD